MDTEKKDLEEKKEEEKSLKQEKEESKTEEKKSTEIMTNGNNLKHSAEKEENKNENFNQSQTSKNEQFNEQEVMSEFKEIKINEESSPISSQTPQTPDDSSKKFPNFGEKIIVSANPNKTRGKTFFDWSKSTLAYTKQFLSESLGYGTRTVDPQLQEAIKELHEQKEINDQFYQQSNTFTEKLIHFNQSQKEFGLFLSEWALKDSSAHKQEMSCCGEMLREINKHQVALENVMKMFVNNIYTLSSKTLTETLQSCKQYEVVRLEFDSQRVELENLKRSAKVGDSTLKETEALYMEQLAKFDQSRISLGVKIKLALENKEKVIKRNLAVLHETLATSSQGASESAVDVSSHFDLRPSTPRSWLENTD